MLQGVCWGSLRRLHIGFFILTLDVCTDPYDLNGM